MNEPIRIIRYNTGTDKKALSHFKREFDAIIINASIVAYSGSSVADLVSMYNHKHIIDPMTHIFQQEMSAIMSSRNKEQKIKQSIIKYSEQLPKALQDAILGYQLPLTPIQIKPYIDNLVTDVYSFETEHISKYIEKKEYDKYLKFANIVPGAKIVIAPYFMLKKRYTTEEKEEWLELNKQALLKTIEYNSLKNSSLPVAAQLVIDKEVLLDDNLLFLIEKTYKIKGYDYFFIWIDDFNAFEEGIEVNQAFTSLIRLLNAMNKKPIMAYGGYESILLCSANSYYKLYGVAQSVGYGEYRSITPVGGGIPVNKYYFQPLHQRMKYDEVTNILAKQGFFETDSNPEQLANRFYDTVCNCKICKGIIKNDFNNFIRFNDSTPYLVNLKSGPIERNRPSSEALLIAALHFLYCKINEWKKVSNYTFSQLTLELINSYEKYLPEKAEEIKKWCSIYEKD